MARRELPYENNVSRSSLAGDPGSSRTQSAIGVPHSCRVLCDKGGRRYCRQCVRVENSKILEVETDHSHLSTATTKLTARATTALQARKTASQRMISNALPNVFRPLPAVVPYNLPCLSTISPPKARVPGRLENECKTVGVHLPLTFGDNSKTVPL
jgi:hypothetical protein